MRFKIFTSDQYINNELMDEFCQKIKNIKKEGIGEYSVEINSLEDLCKLCEECEDYIIIGKGISSDKFGFKHKNSTDDWEIEIYTIYRE